MVELVQWLDLWLIQTFTFFLLIWSESDYLGARGTSLTRAVKGCLYFKTRKRSGI